MILPPLSYTFLSNYENCPRKAWHLYVAKDLPREAPTPAMQAGIVAHTAFETALKGNLPERAPDRAWASILLAIPNKKLIEEPLAISGDGTPADFFSPDVWLRGKADVAIVAGPIAMLLDWKTGKPREEPFELEIQAVLLQAHFPGVESIGAYYVWEKLGWRLGPMHDVSDTQKTLEHVAALEAKMQAHPEGEEWPANPNPLCGYCRVETCKFWRKGK